MPPSNPHLRLFLLFFFISALILLADRSGKLSPLRSILELPVVPTKAFFYQQKSALDYQFSSLSRCQVSQQQLDTLQIDHQQLAQLTARLGELQEENSHLRKLLGAPLPPEWQFLPAKVIGKDTGVIFLNQGRLGGVRQSMTVIAQGVFIGQVASVTDHQAVVDLPSVKLKIPVIVRHPQTQIQVAKGVVETVNSQLLLTKVLPSENLQSGDVVITNGEGGFLPDIPLATIDKAFMDQPTDAFQQATLTPLTDLSSLNRVEIVINW
jgi:rod shape-determining protein MreC